MEKTEFIAIKETMVRCGWKVEDILPKTNSEKWGFEMVRGDELFYLNGETAENLPKAVIRPYQKDEVLSSFQKQFPTFSVNRLSRQEMEQMLSGEKVAVFHKTHKFFLTSAKKAAEGVASGKYRTK